MALDAAWQQMAARLTEAGDDARVRVARRAGLLGHLSSLVGRGVRL
ncbi:hypothetical protein ACFQY7_41220 [Actinomadura luteofluorescens]